MKQIALDIGLASVPSFANFYAGSATQSAQASQASQAFTHLMRCAAEPLFQPEPVYLWGAEGSGKSHLLAAFAHTLREQGTPVGWLDASRHAPPAFHPAWGAVLLDDCHLYTPSQQHAAFNWFVNAIATHDGQPRRVIAAGNGPPAALALRDDLRSRLAWGQVFQLQVLGENDRRAVLKREAEARGVLLTQEAVDFMLNHFSRDLGSLMLLLDQLDRYALQTRRAITVPLIKLMLENEG